MKNLRQLLQRAGWVKSKKRSRPRSKQERRQLITQTLEKRELLAGDVVNPNHNYWHALDATNDQVLTARDALVIMNQLAVENAVGEKVDSNGFLLDTNNDGNISPADALVVMNGLRNGEELGELVELLLTARDLNDVNLNPTTTLSTGPNGEVIETYDPTVPINVNVGERFKLEVAYNDLRTFGGDIGAFQIFADIIAGTGSGVIEGANNASPVLITSTAHGLNTGDTVVIEGAIGNGEIGTDPLNLNGTRTVTVVSPNTFSLDGVDATTTESYASGGRWTRTPGNLKPVLNETQRLVFNEGVRSATTGSYLFTLEGSAATYTSTLAAFGGNPTQEMRNALNAFGYAPDQYHLTKLETGDDNIRFEIRYTDPSFGNVDLPDIAVADLFDVSAPVTLTEFSPFLADGVTPNSDALRFSLDTRSRTYDVDVEHPQGADFYDQLNAGAYEMFTGFDEVGGTGGIPNGGGGVPELAEDDFFFEPFDVFSLVVFFDAPSSLPVDVSVNPGEGDEAALLYGDNDPVTQDVILIDNDATVRFNVSDGVVDRFDPVKAAITYQATVAENFPTDLVISRPAPERVISTVIATDADPTDTVSYAITAGNTSGLFEINSATGAVSLAAGQSLDAETATSHVLTVTANESNGPGSDTATVTLTVTDVDEFDPEFTADNYPATVADDIADTFVIATVLATEADLTGVVSYAITSGNNSGLFEINSSTGEVSLATGQSLTSPATHTLTVTASESDGPGTDTALVTITVTGDAPVDDFDPVFNPVSYTPTVAENIADTVVITTVSATDADPTDTVSYAITAGNTSGLFEINSSTGAVSLAPGRSLDAETTTSHVLTVRADESDGSGFDTATVTITVTDVDEFNVGTVTDTNTNANAIAENATADTPVQITAFATDADLTNNTITYSLAAGTLDNDLFQIDANSGVVSLKTSGSLDAETASSHTIEVTATSSDTSSNTAQFTINVTDVNEDPLGAVTDSNGNANAIAENATAGTPVQITALASDPDVSDTVSYSLAAGVEDNDLFVINPTTGVVTLKTTGSLSGQANTSRTIEVTATSSDTSSNTGQFTINVTEVDDFDVGEVTDVDGDANTIAEDATAGTAVQITAFATDMDTSNNTITYSLAAGTLDNDLFQIDANSGVVSLKTSGSLDAETASSHTIEVTATSSDTSSNTAQFTIDVTDVDEFDVGAVTDSNGNANAIAENATAGTPVQITALASDADVSNNTISYSLAAGVEDNDLFVINPTTGVVTLKTTGSLSGQANTSRTIEVTATSSDTSSNTGQFTINVTEVDDFDVGEVTDVDGDANTIAEDATAGTAVQITAFATDMDTSNNTITYSLAAGTLDNDLFQIDANSGVVSLKTSGSLDAETASSHTIEVTATSSDTSSNTAQFTIDVTDVDEFDVGAVTDSNGSANAIAENATAGTPVQITALASDADVSNNTISYSLAAGVEDNDLFVINPTTGVVTLKTTGSLSGQSNSSKTIEITATSSDTSSNTAQFTIDVTEVPPTDITGTLFIDEMQSARNGVMDPGESGLGGVRVHLRSLAADNSTGQDINRTMLTDAHGNYLFVGVPTGSFELEYELPDQVVYVGSNIMTLEVGSAGGVITRNLAALGLSGALASVDILASAYLLNGAISDDSNGGLEGGSVKLGADGVQDLIVLGEGFDEADFVEFVLNESKDAGAITKVVNGVRSTARVSSDHFIVGADGCSVRFYGGLDDFVFDNAPVDEFPDLGKAVDEYFQTIGQLN